MKLLGLKVLPFSFPFLAKVLIRRRGRLLIGTLNQTWSLEAILGWSSEPVISKSHGLATCSRSGSIYFPSCTSWPCVWNPKLFLGFVESRKLLISLVCYLFLKFHFDQESERASSLTVCDSLYISIAPLSNYGDIGRAPYTLFAFEAGGVLTVTQVHEDGLWQVKHKEGSYIRSFVQINHRADLGSRLFLAFLDSLWKSGGILPTIFTCESFSPL